jgi:hypothetical protein
MNAVIPAAMARRLMASMLAKSGEGAGAPPQRIVAAVCLRDSVSAVPFQSWPQTVSQKAK